MDFWKSLNGMLEVELVSGDPAQAISAVNAAGITVYGAERDDKDIVTRFCIRRQDYKMLKRLAQRKGYSLRLAKRRGLYWTVKSLLHRPVLTVGLLLFFVIAMYLPSRIYFFEVEGNVTIPTRLILEKCDESGISFGVSRRQIRSEKMKNALLEAIPQLQWAGINTSGCTAIITVRERTVPQDPEKVDGVSSIVASRDGVITQCTVVRGNAVCKPGQAVKAGEMLISGYTDCGITIQATRAAGEVYAQTNRNLTVLSPLKWQTQKEKTVTIKKFALIIGKNRINFYKGSGISDTSCDKIYEESYLTLPGGFRLPVILVTESWTYFEEDEVVVSLPNLSDFADTYLRNHMIAGTVLSRDETGVAEDAIYRFEGNYACTEMIGQVRSEEIIKPYEQYD